MPVPVCYPSFRINIEREFLDWIMAQCSVGVSWIGVSTFVFGSNHLEVDNISPCDNHLLFYSVIWDVIIVFFVRRGSNTSLVDDCDYIAVRIDITTWTSYKRNLNIVLAHPDCELNGAWSWSLYLYSFLFSNHASVLSSMWDWELPESTRLR